jgi:hypothetical protein
VRVVSVGIFILVPRTLLGAIPFAHGLTTFRHLTAKS